MKDKIALALSIIALAAAALALYSDYKNIELYKILDRKITKAKIGVSILDSKIYSINEDIDNIRRMMAIEDVNMIDFSSDVMQKIDDHFYIGGIDIRPQRNGVRISGQIINATSLVYEQLGVKFKFADTSKTFHIKKINAGAGAKFNIFIPDTTPKACRYGTASITTFTATFMRQETLR